MKKTEKTKEKKAKYAWVKPEDFYPITNPID